jgi:MSHA biogenesis protein MshI
MSLLTKISKFLSKKQSNQLIGIALQQQGISLCSIPVSTKDKIETKLLVDDSITSEVSPSQNDNQTTTVFQKVNVISGEFSSQLKRLQDELQLSGQAHLVLNDHQTQIVQVDKPSVPEAEICAALKWQVKDLVTISPDNMVVDYFDAPVLAGSTDKINVVCASLSELKSLVSTINQDDIELASITTQEFAFANLLAVQKDACLLVCQQPNEEIVLLIVKEGQLLFHRRLRGFAHIGSKSEDELSMSVIDNLSLEIQRSTDYYERQLKQAPIRELKVLLPIALEGFFARKLAENTNVSVGILALPSPYHQHREYAAAIGALLGGKK